MAAPRTGAARPHEEKGRCRRTETRAAPDLTFDYRGRSRTSATTFRKSPTTDRSKNTGILGLSSGIWLARRPQGVRYSDRYPAMTLRLALLIACAATVSASPAFADARSDAKAQVEFGINVAQRGLWREAIYRWEKAAELDPTYAAAFNDLAIAYEHEGQLDKARKAYERALELDPNNAQVRQNYELFKEINDRTGAAKDKD